ncbi:myoD family inhibitor domain-containing protein-like isoform X2 [Brienomyrus brachyistius]|uniref:myoD family inhibitor domain-containing protein-like isoform X2 n=1 Tax=Brienomyrus brachyistius TaxID=42636 RepID=UPI0020B2E09F|nr:myoD family inhibitor domain-containing protein-like isoform X2 [Brienomyrus brachyistius]
MSQETASPLKNGSSVRDGLLLFNGCGFADSPADSEGRPGTLASAEEFPGPWDHVTTGSSTNGDLVRNQPEPLDVEAGKGGGGVPLHSPATRPKKQPVSHRVQHKLRSVGRDRGHSVDSLPEGRLEITSLPLKHTLFRGLLAILPIVRASPASLTPDCCVHCVLACLFCQFDRVCGSCLFFFCCCCRCWRYCEPDSSDPEDGSDCTCESCCGLVGSTECLEFSKDCCGICFPT